MSVPDRDHGTPRSLPAHPLHPVLAIAPLALLGASVALDLATLIYHAPFQAAARWALGAGAIAGVIIAIPGVFDALAYPPGARGIPVRHGITSGATVLLMAAGWWLRGAGAPVPLALLVSIAAVVTAVITRRSAARLTR